MAALALFLAAPRLSAQTVWGNALALDGVDDHLQAGAVPLANSSFTLEAWARRDTSGTMDMIVAQGSPGVSRGLMFGFHWDWVGFVFDFYGDGVVSTNLDNAWHHWAGTYNATNRVRCLYRDGVLIGANVAAQHYQGSGPLFLGREPFGDPACFAGVIDEVRIWKVARSQDEIQANLGRSLTGLEANLLAYWRFDEAEGHTTHDSSTNGYDATFVNGPFWTNSTLPTLLVTNLLDSGAGSLRQAIADATSGMMIVLTNTGTLTLTTGQLTITNNLSIVGPGAANLAISGNNSSRIFNIAPNIAVSISGMTIRDGHSPNGANGVSASAPGSAGSPGGGIYNAGLLTLSGCIITNNQAGDGGNGQQGSDSVPSVAGTPGGAGGTGGAGGGIYNHSSGSLWLQGCAIRGNISGRGGNGGRGGWGDNYTLLIGYGMHGGAGGPGGAGGAGSGIYNAGLLSLDSSLVSENRCGSGATGGDGGKGGNSNIFYHGANGGSGGTGGPGGEGGAVYGAGNVSLINSTIGGNYSGSGGAGGHGGDRGSGGIGEPGQYGAPGGGGVGGGGGAFQVSTSLQLVNCTIAYNGAGAGGPAGDWPSAGAVGAAGRAGGIRNAGTASLRNTIVAANTRPTSVPDDLYGAFASLGHNLIGNTSGSTGFGATGDLLNTDAMLAPLADNGGPTLTHAPLVDSPAINGGDNTGAPATDQRGSPRIAGLAIDIGALEAELAPAFTDCSVLAPGELRLKGSGTAGLTYTLQVSTNLVNWVDHTNVVANLVGLIDWQGQLAPTSPSWFYRLKWP